jgi:hypothetical protein
MLDIKNYIFFSFLLWCTNVLANQEQTSSVPLAQECKQPDFVQTKNREYPSRAIRYDRMGAVVFQYSIDEKGLATNVELLDSNAIPVLQESAKDYLGYLHFNVNDQWTEKCKSKKFRIVYYFVINSKCPEIKDGDIPAICTVGCKVKLSGTKRLSESEMINACGALERGPQDK